MGGGTETGSISVWGMYLDMKMNEVIFNRINFLETLVRNISNVK